MIKYVWVVADKQDSLWVKWVNNVHIKDQNWLTYIIETSCSWYWKQICKMKELAKAFYKEQELTWLPKFSIKLCYMKMVGEIYKVHWDRFIWNRLTIPKHRFIYWMIMQEKLRTANRLKSFGMSDMHEYVLCSLSVESHKHLFFECNFGKEVSDYGPGLVGNLSDSNLAS